MERAQDAQDRWVVIQWFGTPCSCRCRHCSLGDQRRISRVPFSRAKGVAERFLHWVSERGIDNLIVDILTGYSSRSHEAIDALLFNKQHGAINWHYVPSNGMVFLSEQELRSHFAEIKELGVTTIGLTFFGLRDFHDARAMRRGDFDYTMLIAGVSADLGFRRNETVFLSRSGIEGIPELVDILDSLPGERDRIICLWDYRGRGKDLEADRVLAGELDALPEKIKRNIGSGYRSESEWVQAIEAGEYPIRNRRAYLISIWEDNIDWLESADCGHILESIRSEDDHLNDAVPSLPVLARLYGDTVSDRLYALRDLEWKWTDQYLDDHLEVSPVGRFSDLGSTVLWH